MPREVGFSPDGKRLYILDRSHRVPGFRVATPRSLSQRVIAPMLQPATV